MRFHMQLLARFSRQNIEYLRERFVSEVIKPNVMPAAVSLVESMRESGYTLLMATGTNAFIAEPVAKIFGIEHLLATRPVSDGTGEFNGEYTGGFCYGAHAGEPPFQTRAGGRRNGRPAQLVSYFWGPAL